MNEVQRLAQACYDEARATDAPTRAVAQRLISEADPTVVATMAVEFLVSVVAREHRTETLNVERAAQDPPAGTPRKGTKARERWETETEAGRAWAAAEESAEIRQVQMLSGVLGRALDRYAEDLHIQWTIDLLDARFALRDGTSVTWGDATAEQHEERRRIFLENAHSNMEGAARHELALRELREAGACTLREMLAQVAP